MVESQDFLGLPGIITTKVTETPETFEVECETVDPKFPWCCLVRDLVSFGTRSKRRIVNDTMHGGKAAVLLVKVKRARCRACQKKGIDEIIPHLHDGRHMTERLYDFVARQGLVQTNTSLGRLLHLSEGTVRSVVHDNISVQVAKLERKTPRVLGLDEKMIVGAYRAVLGNVEARTVLDMLPDRDWHLDAWLRDLQDKETIEVLCTDMHWPYAKFRAKYLPHAAHVVDKFHVLRRANLAVDKVRASIAQGLTGKDRTELRNAKKIFAMRSERIGDWAHDKIKQWSLRHPALGEAYWAKERYFEMYEVCHTPEEAAWYYDRWVKTLPASISAVFRKSCSIRGDWRAAVFSYFDHPFTTGYVEAVNRVIDDINRAGRGYSFEIIRGKMLLAPRLEKKSFRDRHPGMMYDGPDEGPPEFERLGIDVEELAGMIEEGWIDRYTGMFVGAGPATIEHLAGDMP